MGMIPSYLVLLTVCFKKIVDAFSSSILDLRLSLSCSAIAAVWSTDIIGKRNVILEMENVLGSAFSFCNQDPNHVRSIAGKAIYHKTWISVSENHRATLDAPIVSCCCCWGTRTL